MVNKLKELRSTGAEEGFTLIELMIVVVIIGILAAIAIPIFANQQRAAITSGLKSDVKNTNTNIATALVKAPTAEVVQGTASRSNGKGNIKTKTADATAVTTFDIVISDSGTAIAVVGAWNTYLIQATNLSSDLGDGVWTYSAQSGKASSVVE